MHFVLYLKSETVLIFYTHKYTRANTHSTLTHTHTHTHTHYSNRCQMGKVLDIQFIFSSECSSHCAHNGAQPPLGQWHCGPRTRRDKLGHGGAMAPRTHPGSTYWPGEEVAAKISSHPLSADKSAMEGHSPGTSAISASPFTGEPLEDWRVVGHFPQGLLLPCSSRPLAPPSWFGW